jgi:hypothetical protein
MILTRAFCITLLLCSGARVAAPPTAQAQLPPVTECGPLVHHGEARGFTALPQGDLFCPRVADPKEGRTFISLLHGRSAGGSSADEPTVLPFETTIGAIGIGDGIGLVRWAGARAGDGLQIGIAAGIFAQFDLEAASFDLINADYIIALPVTFRRRGFSSRLRLYHQSSHLGDEFLLREEPERLNLAFESLELILSQAFGPIRLYAGAEHLFNREPDDLESTVAHAGLEVRPITNRSVRLVGALDVKSTEQQDWQPAWSARAGLEIGWARDPTHPPRVLRVLGEFYDGPSPYGQFYRDQLRYWGVGLHVTR